MIGFILDRIVNSSHRINLKVESLRKGTLKTNETMLSSPSYDIVKTPLLAQDKTLLG